MTEEAAKSSLESRVTIIHRPLPEEANHDGNVYGGNIMRHMDGVGAIAAVRHARGPLLTAAVEYMSFRSPVRVDELMIFHAAVNAVWNSSLEVGIRTEAEDPYTGERRHACTCYLTFVHVDAQRRPTRLPRFIPADDEARRRMADANRRAAFSRIQNRHKLPRLGSLHFTPLPGTFAVCKLDAASLFPDPALFAEAAFISCTRSGKELSLVLDTHSAEMLLRKHPGMAIHSDLACLKVEENDIFPMAGVLSSITTMLAAAQISLLTVSTYDSCHVLLHKNLLPVALDHLRQAGHCINQ